MTEDLLEDLKSDWQRQEIQLDQLRRGLGRSRRRTRWVIFVEAALTVIGIVTGLGYAVLAWKRRDVLLALSALALLVVCPAFSLEFYRLRRRSLDWSDQSPEGTLHYALQRLRVMRKILRLQSWSSLALLLLVGIMWAAVWMGWISRKYPSWILWILTAAWVAAGIATLLWAQWRLRRNDLEYRNCESLLSTFANAAENGSVPGG